LTAFIQQIVNGLQLGLVYAVIALGYTMVYGIIKLINFAHGDVFMVGAFMGYFGYTFIKLPWPLAIVMAMVVCAVIGALNERIVYRPLRYAAKISALISAIGASFFIEYFTSLKFIFGPNYIVIHPPVPDTAWMIGGVRITLVQVIILVTVVVFLSLLQLLIFRTKMGAAMRTVSYDHDAARLMGVDVDRTISFTFATGSALAGIGGVLFGFAYPQIWTFLGVMTGLKAFIAAVLGGIGIIPGAVLGALIMGQIEIMSAAYISSQARDAIAFVILIIVLLIRPAGLLGRNEPEKI
jgi:branched-chain amino acid transport system permease protein